MNAVKRILISASPLILVSLVASQSLAGGKSTEKIPVTTDSKEARALFHKGQAALDVGNGIDANAYFREAVEKDPEFAYAWLNIGNSSFSTEEFNDAMVKAKQYSKHVSEGEKLLIGINATFLDNNAEKRVELAKELTHKHPHSPRAWLSLSGVHAGLNQHEKARASAEKAVALSPDFPLPYTTLGFSYLFNDPKDFSKAEKYMKKAIAIDPEEAQFYVNLGDVHRAMNKLDQARDDYGKAVTLDQTNGLAHIKKAHINSFLGNYDEAREDYDRSIEQAQQQNKANFANYKAFTYLHEGNADAAHEALGELLAQTDTMNIPDHQKVGAKMFALTNDATICLHTGMYDDAERVLTKRTKLIKHNINEVGTAAYERAQMADVAYWDGLLAARRGDFAKAKELAAQNAELVEPDQNPRKMENYHDLMGLISLLQKNYEQAVEHYQRANLTTMYTKYHLALAYDGAGRKNEAKKMFSEVANWNFNSVGFALVRKDALHRS